jgi:hypothetical protein
MITFTINSKFRFDMKQEIFPNSFTFNISRNFTTVEIIIFSYICLRMGNIRNFVRYLMSKYNDQNNRNHPLYI